MAASALNLIFTGDTLNLFFCVSWSFLADKCMWQSSCYSGVSLMFKVMAALVLKSFLSFFLYGHQTVFLNHLQHKHPGISCHTSHTLYVSKVQTKSTINGKENRQREETFCFWWNLMGLFYLWPLPTVCLPLCVFFRDSSVPGSAVWARWRWGHPGPGRWRRSYRLPCQRWTHTATQGCSRPPPYSPAGKHSRSLLAFSRNDVI